MGRACFLALLLICAVLSLSLHQGDGRRVKVLKHFGRWSSHRHEIRGIGRELVDREMDYEDPGANTNPKSGAVFFNPPPRN